MNEESCLLYKKVMAFEIDDEPVQWTFSQRLARENGWSMAFTESVIHEYKRFIFLSVSVGHIVTPSDQVDQAWHLHLTYTQSYWNRLCHDILGRPLHHVPTQGGGAEARKFDNFYRRTLESYKKCFGESPPPDIWPDPTIRFGDDLHFQRVNTRRYWTIRKPQRIRIGSRIKKIMVWGGLFISVFSITILGDGVHAESGATRSPSQADSYGDLIDVIFLMIACGVWFFLKAFFARCSACQRLNAVVKTNVEEVRTDNKKWEEYQCKYCNHRVWREINIDSAGGGCGCGGCGGGG